MMNNNEMIDIEKEDEVLDYGLPGDNIYNRKANDIERRVSKSGRIRKTPAKYLEMDLFDDELDEDFEILKYHKTKNKVDNKSIKCPSDLDLDFSCDQEEKTKFTSNNCEQNVNYSDIFESKKNRKIKYNKKKAKKIVKEDYSINSDEFLNQPSEDLNIESSLDRNNSFTNEIYNYNEDNLINNDEFSNDIFYEDVKFENDENPLKFPKMDFINGTLFLSKKKKAKERKFQKFSKYKFDENYSDKFNNLQKKKRQKGYTAYMLWSAMQRPKVIIDNPGIDFVQISKFLGDMWQTISDKEKLTWRKKARKLAAKKLGIRTSYLNPKKLDKLLPEVFQLDSNVNDGNVNKSNVATIKMVHKRRVGRPPKDRSLEENIPFHYKVNIEPIDVAAHFKLLSESLILIGQRLQEHRGRIAVHGSLSVLLDSLMCILSPVMCLTKQIPELDNSLDEINKETLSNIACIMPGLG